MRNQQTFVIRENAFYPEIEPLCDRSGQSDERESPKVAMCITATGRRLSAGVQEQVKSGVLHLEYQRDCHGDITSLAQPVNVPEKKDRPIKRHAGDLTIKAENGVYPEKRLRSSSFTFRPTQSSTDTDHKVLEKRVRSSSFTVLTSFPPNQPGLKNNVFMPSTLLPEQGSSTTAGNLQSWTVIKPATLQPPPATVCRDVGKTDAAAASTVPENKQHEGKGNTPVSKTDETKSSPGSTCLLDMATRMQLFQQRFMPQKYNVDFVFGENMERRVMLSSPPTKNSGVHGSVPGKSPKRPMASQTSAIKREMPSTRVSCNRNWPYQRRISHRSLIESAAAYTSRPKLKYELDQVDIVTGEESDRNVLQVNCKLFVFNKEKQVWTERGHGYLRLNDTAISGSGQLRSRIVMRNHGNLKLILNSKIFDGMKLERANRKSVRLTATDLGDSSVRIFLVQASVKDAARLYAAIHHRLIALKSQRDLEQEPSSPKSEAEEDSHIQLLNSDTEDEEDDEMLLYPSKISDHHQWIRRQPALYS